MKLFLIAMALTLVSCSKNRGWKEPSCHLYLLLSDKYNVGAGDTTYDHTDTLSLPYSYACGSDLDSMRSHMVTWYHDCTGYPVQCERYVFDGQTSYPKLFK